MGFGLMKPDWFSGGVQYGIFWPAKKTDGSDPAYHATLCVACCLLLRAFSARAARRRHHPHGRPYPAKTAHTHTLLSRRATVTDAGQGTDLPFTYYSLSENITDTDGTPFLMHAPSPYGMVVNEYYDFEPTTFAVGDPIFALPSSPKCVPVGTANSAKEAHALVAAASPALATLHLTEVFAAALPQAK
jgi:hypothetical protein